MGTNVRSLPTGELLKLFAEVTEELRNRGVTRSTNSPVADYAEWLVAKALRLKLAGQSTAGFDARDGKGRLYEIKARRRTPHSTPSHLSAIRGLEKDRFDFLVAVLFRADFTVERAAVIPKDLVKRVAVYRPHVNGWIVYLRDALGGREGIRDVTNRLAAVQQAAIGAD